MICDDCDKRPTFEQLEHEKAEAVKEALAALTEKVEKMIEEKQDMLTWKHDGKKFINEAVGK